MAIKYTYKLTLSYDGSTFRGWHTQKNTPTIQGTLNEILSDLYKEKIFIWGAGRTDSGAHAIRYTAHFRTHSNLIPINNLKKILNNRLPAEIRIFNVMKETNKFHATFTCKARTYCYIIFIGDILFPHLYKKVYHERETFDLKLFQQAIQLFEGTHNFFHFCYGYTPQERRNKMMQRRIDYIHCKQKGEYIYIFIKGEGFLRGMIRTIIGTSLSVAKNHLKIQDIQNSLNGQLLSNHLWKPVPAEGLYFKRAHY